MTETAGLTCANCGRQLDPSDKFCRECGLPTMRRVETQKQVSDLSPDTDELRRALDAAPDPQPFLRPEPDVEEAVEGEPLAETTSSVVRATSPTHAFQMAASTLVMVVVIVLLAVAGIAFLVLAFRP